MEETEYLIKQEDYEKYKKLLQEFECKAIDIIEDLTYQFKETLAEEIDDKIKGWKKDNERILRENWEKDDKIKQLEQELAELKEKYIIPKFQLGQTIFTANKPNECIYELKIVSIHIERSEFCDRKFNSLVYLAERIKDGFIGGYSEEDLFATEQEALNKLKEIQGNE